MKSAWKWVAEGPRFTEVGDWPAKWVKTLTSSGELSKKFNFKLFCLIKDTIGNLLKALFERN